MVWPYKCCVATDMPMFGRTHSALLLTCPWFGHKKAALLLSVATEPGPEAAAPVRAAPRLRARAQ